MTDAKPRSKSRPALAHQPDWARRHAHLMTVEPFLSLPAVERDDFLVAIAVVSEEADLRPEHRRLLGAARHRLERRDQERARDRRRGENGQS